MHWQPAVSTAARSSGRRKHAGSAVQRASSGVPFVQGRRNGTGRTEKEDSGKNGNGRDRSGNGNCSACWDGTGWTRPGWMGRLAITWNNLEEEEIPDPGGGPLGRWSLEKKKKRKEKNWPQWECTGRASPQQAASGRCGLLAVNVSEWSARARVQWMDPVTLVQVLSVNGQDWLRFGQISADREVPKFPAAGLPRSLSQHIQPVQSRIAVTDTLLLHPADQMRRGP